MGGTLCIVEVKYRTGPFYGTPAESVGIVKQKKLISLAKTYLSGGTFEDYDVRFDVIEVYPDKISHIINAFEEE